MASRLRGVYRSLVRKDNKEINRRPRAFLGLRNLFERVTAALDCKEHGTRVYPNLRQKICKICRNKMHDSYLLLLLVLSCNAVSGSVFSALKESVQSLLDTSRRETGDTSTQRSLKIYLQEKNQDVAKDTISVQKNVNVENKYRHDESYFHDDPEFDSLKNRRIWQKPKFKKVSSSDSSEMEMQFWMEDWEEQTKVRKFEALNTSRPPSDVVNMKMARPSGIPCGDPNQHDLPWGSCMRTVECEPEFRIHRGDSFCGRSQYVCCSIIITSYDMYQANEMSFEHDNSQTSDSELEKRYRDVHEVKRQERLKRKHERNKKRRTKALLKKKIRHRITNIITEITKLLQRSYRNATSLRVKKAKELMDFIKKMKKQYRNDRQSLVDAHEFDILKYDLALEQSLKKIRGVNQAFMTNQTFRDIVINGTVNKKELMKLQRTHPVLSLFYKSRRMGGDLEPEQIGKEELVLERESTDEPELGKELTESEKEESTLKKILLYQLPEIEEDEPKSKKQSYKPLDYDVEYGMLYY